jgi:hypothetical protein
VSSSVRALLVSGAFACEHASVRACGREWGVRARLRASLCDQACASACVRSMRAHLRVCECACVRVYACARYLRASASIIAQFARFFWSCHSEAQQYDAPTVLMSSRRTRAHGRYNLQTVSTFACQHLVFHRVQSASLVESGAASFVMLAVYNPEVRKFKPRSGATKRLLQPTVFKFLFSTVPS